MLNSPQLFEAKPKPDEDKLAAALSSLSLGAQPWTVQAELEKVGIRVNLSSQAALRSAEAKARTDDVEEGRHQTRSPLQEATNENAASTNPPRQTPPSKPTGVSGSPFRRSPVGRPSLLRPATVLPVKPLAKVAVEASLPAQPRRSGRIAQRTPPCSPLLSSVLTPTRIKPGRGNELLCEINVCMHCEAEWLPGSITYSTFKRFNTMCGNGKQCRSSPSYNRNCTAASARKLANDL